MIPHQVTQDPPILAQLVLLVFACSHVSLGMHSVKGQAFLFVYRKTLVVESCFLGKLFYPHVLIRPLYLGRRTFNSST